MDFDGIVKPGNAHEATTIHLMDRVDGLTRELDDLRRIVKGYEQNGPVSAEEKPSFFQIQVPLYKDKWALAKKDGIRKPLVRLLLQLRSMLQDETLVFSAHFLDYDAHHERFYIHTATNDYPVVADRALEPFRYCYTAPAP